MGNFGLSLEQRLTPSVARAHSLAEMIAQSLRVALPAIVQSFHPGPPAKVSVLVATEEFFEQNEGGAGKISLKKKSVQLPVLEDVPVMMPTGGGWSFTFPIRPGDECLLIFADTPLDVWFQNGGLGNRPISQRRHSLSDAVAWFGMRSTPRALSGYSTTSAQIRNDAQTVVVDLSDDHVNITAPNVNVTCSGAANVQAGGNVTVQGNQVTIGSATKIDGKTFLSHTHTGVLSGGATTGPVA